MVGQWGWDGTPEIEKPCPAVVSVKFNFLYGYNYVCLLELNVILTDSEFDAGLPQLKKTSLHLLVKMILSAFACGCDGPYDKHYASVCKFCSDRAAQNLWQCGLYAQRGLCELHSQCGINTTVSASRFFCFLGSNHPFGCSVNDFFEEIQDSQQMLWKNELRKKSIDLDRKSGGLLYIELYCRLSKNGFIP